MGEGERVATPAIGQPMRRHVEPNAHAARPPPMIPRLKLRVASCGLRASRLILPMMSRAPRNAQLATVFALVALSAPAAPPSTCGAKDAYGQALCHYQRRNFIEAEAAFRGIVDKNEQDVTTIRALYF